MIDEGAQPNQRSPAKRGPFVAAVAITVVALDLAAKRIATATLGPDAERHAWWLIGDDIGFEYVRNTGAAFGLLEGNPELLAALSILITLGICWLILIEVSGVVWSSLAAGLLLGGAIGNQFGRLFDGYVTDYVAVGPWPRFNVADASITIAMGIFVVALVFFPQDDAGLRRDEGPPTDQAEGGTEVRHD